MPGAFCIRRDINARWKLCILYWSLYVFITLSHPYTKYLSIALAAFCRNWMLIPSSWRAHMCTPSSLPSSSSCAVITVRVFAFGNAISFSTIRQLIRIMCSGVGRLSRTHVYTSCHVASRGNCIFILFLSASSSVILGSFQFSFRARTWKYTIRPRISPTLITTFPSTQINVGDDIFVSLHIDKDIPRIFINAVIEYYSGYLCKIDKSMVNRTWQIRRRTNLSLSQFFLSLRK